MNTDNVILIAAGICGFAYILGVVVKAIVDTENSCPRCGKSTSKEKHKDNIKDT